MTPGGFRLRAARRHWSAPGRRSQPSTTVDVQGVRGVRQEWHYTGDYRCIGAAAITEIEYVFGANGRIYDFDYNYRQGDATDLSSEFDQLVMDTVTFAGS